MPFNFFRIALAASLFCKIDSYNIMKTIHFKKHACKVRDDDPFHKTKDLTLPYQLDFVLLFGRHTAGTLAYQKQQTVKYQPRR